MNSSIRRPLHFTISHPSSRSIILPRPSICFARSFSHAQNLNAGPRGQQKLKPRIPPQMSMRNRVKDTMRGVNREMIPDDIGLLPGTFIRPELKNMPSLFTNPKRRWQMEWASLKMRVQNFISIISYCKFLNKKLPLLFWERKKKALQLHKEMYTAFAAGDAPSLQTICCQGLYQTFSARISRRPASSPTLIWTLHKYFKFPFSTSFSGAQVISDRAAALPGQEGMGIRQTVVRIRSRQSLIKPLPTATTGSPSGSTPNTEQNQEIQKQKEEKQQDCAENVVMQRLMLNGQDGPWKVWGIADETTLEELDKNPLFAPGLSMKDRIASLTMK